MAVSIAKRNLDGVDAPAPGTWTIDPAHSNVEFVVRHLMSRVRGRFGAFEGTVHIDEVPERSSVEVSIDTAGIDTSEATRDEHLKSPDFLDVERYPKLTFRGTKVERTGTDTLRVEGDLTIRDVTRPVTLDVEYLGISLDPWDNSRAAFTAATEIDREEFGITWNQVLETGGVLVGRKVRLELDVTAVLQK